RQMPGSACRAGRSWEMGSELRAARRPPERGVETVGAVGLENVVTRAFVERAERMVFARGHEVDLEAPVRCLLEHVEPLQARHLDIEEYDVRCIVGEPVEGFDAVGSLQHLIGPRRDAWRGLDQADEAPAREWLVLNDQDSVQGPLP